MNNKVTINTYAGLKDYFEESFEVPFNSSTTINDLMLLLKNKNPESTALLGKCRFAVNQEIVENYRNIGNGDVIDVLPPSSGG